MAFGVLECRTIRSFSESAAPSRGMRRTASISARILARSSGYPSKRTWVKMQIVRCRRMTIGAAHLGIGQHMLLALAVNRVHFDDAIARLGVVGAKHSCVPRRRSPPECRNRSESRQCCCPWPWRQHAYPGKWRQPMIRFSPASSTEPKPLADRRRTTPEYRRRAPGYSNRHPPPSAALRPAGLFRKSIRSSVSRLEHQLRQPAGAKPCDTIHRRIRRQPAPDILYAVAERRQSSFPHSPVSCGLTREAFQFLWQ